jgi:hypothetical protein
VEGDRNALAASHPLAFQLGRSCAQRGAAGPADGELVPVEHLVNGVSIVQCEAVERVAYFHVELDSHNVIVAEGAAAETFVDCDSRRMFHNAVEFAILYPGEDAPRWAFCAPRLDDDPKVEAVWRRLAPRAGINSRRSPLPGRAHLASDNVLYQQRDCPNKTSGERLVVSAGELLDRIASRIDDEGSSRDAARPATCPIVGPNFRAREDGRPGACRRQCAENGHSGGGDRTP